jgi:hypothetical protein
MDLKQTMFQFAQAFSNKDAERIGNLLSEDFSLFDPALKWVKGKKAVVDVLKKQFSETQKVSYEILKSYVEGHVGIIEFKILLDQVILFGVDFIQFENGKMNELRCYYNPPHLMQENTLKPLSAQAKSLEKGAIYEHYKGERYQIVGVGHHSETLDECVMYQALYGDQGLWVRPLSIFFETLVIDGKSQPRFHRIK